MLTVRKVEIDFSRARIHWNREEPEFSQFWNALSTGVPYLEPFLIQVLRRVKPALVEKGASPELLRDVDLFCMQEGQHYKQHEKFNRVLREAGYEKVEAEERRIAADYARYLRKKSLRFCLAYCEGFETFGPMISNFYFRDAPDLMKDVDQETCWLWLWHIAEEYEHRTVCNHAYRVLYDDYGMRIYGLWFAAVHLTRHALRVARHLIAKDRERGTIGDALRSRWRYARVLARIFGSILPGMVFRCMRPSYDPGPLPPPGNVLAVLDEAAARHGVIATR